MSVLTSFENDVVAIEALALRWEKAVERILAAKLKLVAPPVGPAISTNYSQNPPPAAA